MVMQPKKEKIKKSKKMRYFEVDKKGEEGK